MMGAKCCVMHGGSYQSGGWGDANPENVSEKAFIETVEIIQSIIDRSSRRQLVVETESHVLPDSPEVLRLIEAVDRKEPLSTSILSTSYRAQGVLLQRSVIRRCFAFCDHISCHAKDVNMPPVHATVQIDDLHGNAFLNYEVYLKEIAKLTLHRP